MALYVASSAGQDRVYVVPEATPNDGTATADRIFTLPNNVMHGGVTVGITAPEALAIDGNNLYIADNSGDEVFIVPADTGNNTTASITRRIVLPSAISSPRGITKDGNNLYISDDNDDNVYVIPADTADNTTASITRTIVLPSAISVPLGLTIDGNNLYIADNDGNVYVIPANTANNTTASITRTIVLPSAISRPQGITINGNSLYIADALDVDIYEIPADTANNTTATITKRFNLPSGVSPSGLTFLSDQANLTITTTDTDIRAGETVNFNIASDTDITGFTAGDITVTGGTRGALTANSATSYSLSVTAGNAGTLVLAIAEDRVLPGNAAVSESFTVNALPTVAITFGTAQAEGGVPFTVTFTWSEDIRGFNTNDVSISAGTKGAFAGSNATYTLQVTPPSTGSGNLTVTVAANALLDLSNVAVSNTVPYAEPLILGWVVPSGDVGNDFSVTLTSNYALTGVALDDFRLIQRNPTNFINLTTSESEIDAVTLTQVSGTHNYQIDFSLNGTFDNEFEMRLVNRRAMFSGMTVPTSNLNSPRFQVDTASAIPPIVTITSSDATIYEGETFTATFQWDQDVTGFVTGDVTVTGAMKGAFTAVDGDTYTLALTAASGAGSIVVDVSSDAVEGGNTANQTSFTRLAFPTATLSTTDTLIRENEVVSFDIVFSAAVTGFTASDITVTGGTRGALTGSGTTYALSVTAGTGGGAIVLAIAANVVSPGNAAVSQNFTRTAYPSITISTTDTDIRERESVDFDIVFTESVTGFTASDVTVTGGQRGTLTGSGDTYSLRVQAGTGAGTINLAIAANAVSPGNAAVSQNFTRTAFGALDISTTDTAIYETETFTVNITFPETVTGFTASDVTVTGGTKGTFAGSGTAYTLQVTAANGAGAIVVSIGEDVTNEGNAPATTSFVRLAFPTATITTTNTNIREREVVNFDITFSAAVSGFVVGDIAVTGASVNALTGSGANYDLSVTAGAGNGTIVISFTSNVVTPGNAAATASFTHTAHPALTITSTDTDIREGETVAISIVFPESVTGFTASDITVTGGTRGALTGTGDTYSLSVVAGTGAGSIVVSVAQDAVDQGNAASMATFTRRALPTITIFTTESDIRENETFDVDITFSEVVTDFTASDITVTGATKGTLTGTGTTYALSVTAGTGSGTIGVSVAANAVTPGNALTSQNFMYLAYPTVAITTTETDIREGEVFNVSIVFTEAVTGFTVGDITVTGATKGTLTGTGAAYTLPLTAGSGAGTIGVSIAQNVVLPGNVANAVSFTRLALPTLAITFSVSEAVGGTEFTAIFTWSETVTGFTADDIDISVGTKGAFAGVGAIYMQIITPPSTGSDTLTVSVGANAIPLGNAAVSANIDYVEPLIISWMVPISTVDNTFTVVLLSNYALTGVTRSDFRLIQRNPSVFNTLTAANSTLTQVTNTHNWQIDFTLDGMYDNPFEVRLLPLSITAMGMPAPDPSHLTSSRFQVDSTLGFLPTPTITVSDAAIYEGETLTATFTWDAGVTEFATGDVTVTGASKGTFTAVSALVYTLELTAGVGAGSIGISIAENVVTPGNTAVAETFSRKPLFNRLYFVNNDANTAAAFGFNGTAQAANNITLPGSTWSGALANTYDIQFIGALTTTSAFDLEGNALPSHSITLSAGNHTGGTRVNNRLYFLDDFTNMAEAYDLDRNRQTSDDIDIGSPPDGSWRGAVASPNRIYFIYAETFGTQPAGTHAYDHFGNRQASDDIDLPSGIWMGGAATDTRLHFIRVGSTTTAAYDFLGNRQTSDDITLGTGDWRAATSLFERPAAIEITTTETDIRESEVFDVNINFTKAVTGFTASDITVTGGTRGALVGGGNSYVLRITAGTGAGTIGVSIAANVVTEGNLAASASFTRLAYPTLTITTADMHIFERRAATFDIEFSESVTGFVVGDITVTGATVDVDSFTGSGTTYRFDVTADDGAGTIVVSIAANVAIPGNQAATASFVRNAQDTVSITTTDTDIRQGETFPVTIMFPQAVTGFTVSDINITGGTLGTLTGSATTYSIPVTAGTNTSEVILSIFEDIVDQGNASALVDFTVSPNSTVTIATTDTDIREGDEFTVTFVWSEEVTLFTTSDINVTGATKGAFSGTGAAYSLVLTAGAGDGSIVISIPANSVNPGNALATQTFARSGDPTATISTTDTDIRENEVFSVDIVFTEAVTGFTASDVTVTGGTRGALTGSGTTYALSVTAASGAGTIGVSIAANVVMPGNVAVSATFTRNALTTLTITTTDTDIRERETFNVDIVFSEAVTGFTTADILVLGGTRGALTGSGTTYALVVTAAAGGGTVQVAVGPNLVIPNNAAVSATFTRSAYGAVTITTTDTDIREGETFDVDIVFAESVTGFTATDVTVAGGTRGALTGSGAAYVLSVTADTAAGSIVVSIAQDVVMPGNNATTGTFTRSALPTLTITTTDMDIQGGEVVNFDILFSESVTGFTASDITVTGGTRGALTGSATNYDLSVTADAGDGTLVISVGANVVMPGNAARSATFTRSAVLMPPVWVTGLALVVNIAAGDDTTVDVAALVTGETALDLISTLQTWMAWDNTTDTLTITNAPAFDVDTEFRVEFQASNTDGTRNAFLRVIVNASKLATLHSSLFFKPPINYDGERVTVQGATTVVPEMTDNDYRTFSTVLDVDIDVSDNGGGVSAIDYIFVKAKGTDIAYSFTPTGGVGTGFTNRTIPTTVVNFEGTDVSTVVSGFIHELYPLPAQVTATSVRLTFTGTDVEVYAIALLQLGLEIKANSRYTDISGNKVDRSGILQQSSRGQVRRQPPISNTRFKWDYNFRCVFSEHSVPEFMNYTETNLNGFFALEFSRHPSRVFPSTFPALRMQNGDLGIVKSAGEFVEFQIAER